MVLRLVGWLLLWGWVQWSAAATVAVPDALKPWQGWVLQGEDAAFCPFYFSQFKSTQCAWPGAVELVLEGPGLQFSQAWSLYAETDIALPGAEGFWPLEVTANGVKVPVVEVKGQPRVHLAAGEYQISGRIPFDTVPESILIPPQTALIKLWKQGALVAQPQFDKDGRLWLAQRQQPRESDVSVPSEDKISLRVFRHLQDDIPFRMETQIELEVGGKPREMVLGKVLFDQFVAEHFESPLPARIEPDGRLRVQLRPGQWVLKLSAHRSGPVDKLFMETAADGFWPEEEVWVFESRPPLRQLRVEGVDSIDPNQTALPDAWKVFPAYRLQAGAAMNLVELRRGDPQPSPNQLTLARTLWLDFDGLGMTAEDRLEGVLYRDWRLTTSVNQQLGSLELAGQPQVITAFNNSQGVEVRQGQLNALALSRIEPGESVHHRVLSSTGWQHDVDQLSASLQLPPGWRVFTITGVDSTDNTWTGSWSVWDIFIVLIAVVAVVRLRGMRAGLVCALALLLIYPEAPEFLYLWLNLIAVMAVLFLLPEGRLRRFFNGYGTLAALVLALWLLTFMVEQARLGLYPQLRQPWLQMGGDSYSSYQEEPYVRAQVPASVSAVAEMALSSAPSRSKAAKPAPKIERMDPNLAAQTGPGRPNWQWLESRLYWSGPVTQAETFDLFLITPLENRLLAWLRVVLGILMIVTVVGVNKQGGKWQLSPWRRRMATTAGVLMVLGLGGVHAPEARADLPDAALLQELKQRLLQEKDCTPACIGIERLQVDVSGQRLTLHFRVHAREAVFWPVPDSQQQWRVEGSVLDGEPHGVRRSEQNAAQLLVAVPAGEHDLVLTGSIARRSFQLTFPLAPHNIVVQAPGWDVRGADNGRLQANGLYFEPQASTEQRTAQKDAEQKPLTPDPVPPFVSVRREIRLGLNWYLETTVQRVAPRQGGITLDIPLLPGESVTSQAIEVNNGMARVNLKPGENTVHWFAALDKTTQLTLQADSSGRWSEHWLVDPSPLWHVESDGIAPVKETGVVNLWKPQWRPYPGEQLILHIQRPEAVAGATSTIDQVQQIITTGQRESQHQLRFHLISSKGSEQRIDLPAGARITQVQVDDESRAADEASQRVIIPVNPGAHWVDVQWRESGDMAPQVVTPKVNLNAPYVNHSIQVQVPAGRWVLFAGGPAMGPAVLFWGVLIVTLIIAFGLGRLRYLPLKTWHWVLLVLGLCAGWIQALIPVALWFVLMHKRSQLDPQRVSRSTFNLLQLGLAALSLFTFLVLIAAIPNGLLGTPDMGVVGNGSSQYRLNWFVDRGVNELSQAWFISIPLWVYRGLMLLWSLWLALKLLGWLQWGWQAFTHEGYWRTDKIQKPEQGETQA